MITLRIPIPSSMIGWVRIILIGGFKYAPHPAAESSHFTFHPTMLQHSHPRLYGGRLANTRLVSTTVRVANVPTPINTIEKPPGSRAHQRGTTLFRFRPEPTFKCCKKKCMSHFLQEHDQRVENARAPLFVPHLSKDDRRLLLRQNWKDHLRIVSSGSERVVCLTCACKIYTCSRALLCPQPSRGRTTQAVRKQRLILREQQ